MTTTRISARLDETRSSKLEHLKRSTGLTVSDIVGRGIDLLFAEQRRGRARALAILERIGFLGSGEGPGDLSERYKEALTEAFDR